MAPDWRGCNPSHPLRPHPYQSAGKQRATWDSPLTGDVIRRACYDCHSNQTAWPWYSSVAPVSWLLQRDVNEGRQHLNFSEWDRPQRHAKDVAYQVKAGEMPPWFYLPMHPMAKLSDAEKEALMAGAEKSLGPQSGPDTPRP